MCREDRVLAMIIGTVATLFFSCVALYLYFDRCYEVSSIQKAIVPPEISQQVIDESAEQFKALLSIYVETNNNFSTSTDGFYNFYLKKLTGDTYNDIVSIETIESKSWKPWASIAGFAGIISLYFVVSLSKIVEYLLMLIKSLINLVNSIIEQRSKKFRAWKKHVDNLEKLGDSG